MKYHQDIRDQLCPFCPLGFHEQKTLKNHLIKIHNIENIRGEIPTKSSTDVTHNRFDGK